MPVAFTVGLGNQGNFTLFNVYLHPGFALL